MLRKTGKSYGEIFQIIDQNIPKSTVSTWCKDIKISEKYLQKIRKINQNNLAKARLKANEMNKIIRQNYLKEIDKNNLAFAEKIDDFDTGMIALAMLCLGEASKAKTNHKSFTLGSSDPRIIVIFLKLLKRMKDFDQSKLRATLQCRADQNLLNLENYWQKISGIPKNQFYKPRIDKRTIGKPTRKINYHGVLVIDYYDRKTQLVLESLAELVYNHLLSEGL